MTNVFEHLIAASWNRTFGRSPKAPARNGLLLGFEVRDGRSGMPVQIAHEKRAEHIVVLGRTGSGKSSFLRNCIADDVAGSRGCVVNDLHGDMIPPILRVIAREEERGGIDLTDRVILIEPGDPEWAVGMNVLEVPADDAQYVYIAEVTALLKRRWGLEALGPRTEELVRNSLLALADSRLTLIDLPLFLTDVAFRSGCVARSRNFEVRNFFMTRYDKASDAMRTVWAEAVLNKVTTFTADPHFRHLLGQVTPTLSIIDALDRGAWILLNVDKARLGEEAGTIAGLFLAKLKAGLFARRSRRLVTLYLDEAANLTAYDNGIETMLAEMRKYAVSVVLSTQHLAMYPPTMRAAVMAVGTHITFQLSSDDADRFAVAADGGKSLKSLLMNLPRRHAVVKTGAERWQHMMVPTVHDQQIDTTDLVRRSHERWARRRRDIEQEIAARQRVTTPRTEEVLHDWE